MKAERIIGCLLSAALAFALVLGICNKVYGQEPEESELSKYEPISSGFCADVQLPCARLVLKNTASFYAVFAKDGTLMAITRKNQDGSEEVIWGDIQLPLEKDQLRT